MGTAVCLGDTSPDQHRQLLPGNLNMQAFFGHFGVRGSYLLWALVVGVIVYGLMLAEGFAYLLKALAYQGIFVVAVWCCSPPIISAGANGNNCKDRSIQAPLPDSV